MTAEQRKALEHLSVQYYRLTTAEPPAIRAALADLDRYRAALAAIWVYVEEDEPADHPEDPYSRAIAMVREALDLRL